MSDRASRDPAMPIRRTLDVPTELVERFRHSGAVNDYLVGALPAAIWRVAPPSREKPTAARACQDSRAAWSTC